MKTFLACVGFCSLVYFTCIAMRGYHHFLIETSCNKVLENVNPKVEKFDKYIDSNEAYERGVGTVIIDIGKRLQKLETRFPEKPSLMVTK